MSHHNASAKSMLFALLANPGIAITKTIAAVITGSGAMMAESIPSFADCGNRCLFFALVAVFLFIITGNPVFDASGSIGIGVLLILISSFLAVKAKMKKVDSAGQLIVNINTCKSELRKQYPAIHWVFFESDFRD